MSGGVSATTAVSIGVAVAGAAASAYGAAQSAHAQSEAGKYNAQLAKNNAEIAKQNADYSAQAGENAAAIEQQKNRAKIGGIMANQGASGLDVNSGSAVDIRESAGELGQLDTMTIRSDAARKAYGYQVDASNSRNQSALDQYGAKSAESAGKVSSAGTILGAGSKINDKYGGFLNSKSAMPDSFLNASDDEIDSFMG